MILVEPIQITQLVVEVFGRLNIDYFICGSLASSLYGIPRATNDIDIVADLKTPHVLPLVKTLEETFYISENMVREAIQLHSSFNIIHLETMLKVDIFVLKNDGASLEEMARREKYSDPDNPKLIFFLASAEDVIIYKLQWYKLGGCVSERQWNDILGVLKVKGENLDLPYIRRMAANLGLDDLLNQAVGDI